MKQPKIKAEKYIVKQFNEQFPDDAACLAYIFTNRYPNGLKCEKCQKNKWSPVKGRRSYACSCGHQIYPTAGTIFHKSPTALKTWFFGVFLFSTSKNGVAAKEIQRGIGVTYKCAWRLCHQIRKLMDEKVPKIKNYVEMDDTWHGPKAIGQKNLHKGKAKIFGMVERGGNAKAIVVKDLKAKTLMPIIKKQVSKGTHISTDEATYFKQLTNEGFLHEAVNHSEKEYVRWMGANLVHTNSI